MSDAPRPASLRAASAPPRTRPSNYPEPFAARMAGRVKRPLGDAFGLRSFGANHTTLAPGAASALHHRHSHQDEFVLVLAGEVVLVRDDGETTLSAGDCAGFPAGGVAHHLVNRSEADAVVLEVGDRAASDRVDYPADDLAAVLGTDGRWGFARKDGTPHP